MSLGDICDDLPRCLLVLLPVHYLERWTQGHLSKSSGAILANLLYRPFSISPVLELLEPTHVTT
jgi:hypothetical protein